MSGLRGGCAAMRIPTAIALRNCFISVANRDLTEGYAADWTMEQLPSRRRPSASPSLKSD